MKEFGIKLNGAKMKIRLFLDLISVLGLLFIVIITNYWWPTLILLVWALYDMYKDINILIENTKFESKIEKQIKEINERT